MPRPVPQGSPQGSPQDKDTLNRVLAGVDELAAQLSSLAADAERLKEAAEGGGAEKDVLDLIKEIAGEINAASDAADELASIRSAGEEDDGNGEEDG